MPPDDIFRIILIAGFIAIMPVGVYHRLKSAMTKEKLDRKQEGWFILLTLRPIALVRMLGVLAFLINPKWMAWSSMPLPAWVRWGGVGIGLCAGVLLIATFRALGPNLTDTVVTRRAHTLVTRGPYRFVRHPFYLAFAMIVIADSLVIANWFIAMTGVMLLALIVLRTRIEERNLIDRLGEDYRAYMRRTGRFLPRMDR